MAKKLKKLGCFDWELLVGAWRYYEYRMTISSASFPGEVVRRYFNGAYNEKSCERIARQFAFIDHPNGEADWFMNCDKSTWCKFYAFCKAYINGFTTIELDDGMCLHDLIQCFYCEYTKRWYPVDKYLKSPDIEIFCAPEYIVEKTEMETANEDR